MSDDAIDDANLHNVPQQNTLCFVQILDFILVSRFFDAVQRKFGRC